MHKVDKNDDCHGFLEELQLHWTCVVEISSACVDNKPRGIKATYIITSDRG